MHTHLNSQLNRPNPLAKSVTITSTDRPNWIGSFKQMGQAVWQQWMRYLTTPPDFNVWQHRNPAGHLYWHVYDPHTNQSACFSSEAEVKLWIEQRLRDRHRADHWGNSSMDRHLHQTNPFR